MERKGICKNVGACSKANKVQIITDDDAEFVCPECGEELQEYKEPESEKKKSKLPIIIGGVVVAAAIIVGCIFAFSDSSTEPTENVTNSLTTDSAKIASTPPPTPDTIVVRDTLVVKDTVVQKPVVKTNNQKASQPKASISSSGTLHLGYGTYTGATKSGKPHGQGRLTYSTSYQISLKDAKKRVADAGDYVIGEFYDGQLVQGVWYGADNQVKGSVIIGR
ncbi:MAG: hypothetical protein K2K03_08850 [Prevotella sp.]|nr:hypothetical protein [Prevotella sp.]